MADAAVVLSPLPLCNGTSFHLCILLEWGRKDKNITLRTNIVYFLTIHSAIIPIIFDIQIS